MISQLVEEMLNNDGFERWILCGTCEVLSHMMCVKLNRVQEEVGTVIWLTLILFWIKDGSFCRPFQMSVQSNTATILRKQYSNLLKAAAVLLPLVHFPISALTSTLDSLIKK